LSKSLPHTSGWLLLITAVFSETRVGTVEWVARGDIRMGTQKHTHITTHIWHQHLRILLSSVRAFV